MASLVYQECMLTRLSSKIAIRMAVKRCYKLGYFPIEYFRTAFYKIVNGITICIFFCLIVSSQLWAENNKEPSAELQRALTYFGFPAGKPDGILGQKTKNAIKTLQSCIDITNAGELSRTEHAFLVEAYQLANLQNLTGSCALLQSMVETAYECPAAHWTRLFSCNITGKNARASVCAAIDQVRYTFGINKQIPKIRLQGMLTKAYVPWMGEGRYVNDDLGISSADKTYRVYSSFERSDKKNFATGGIDIIQKDQIVAALRCDPDSFRSNISAASRLLEVAGLCWDKEAERWEECAKLGDWRRFVEGPIFPYEAYQLGKLKSGCITENENGNVNEKAYEFALYLQELIRSEDLPSLYDNVKSKLINGPSKEQTSGKNFKHFFSDQWIKTVLSIEPECTPVGIKGYMIGGGLIWFDRLRDRTNKNYLDGWTIISINNDKTMPRH